MIEEKRQIILDMGVPVQVKQTDGTLLHETKSLIGKATKQFFSEISLEYHRKGIFVPEVTVSNGVFVDNMVTNETYLVVATMPELIMSEVGSTIARLIECNSKVTIKGISETADQYGNITTEPVTKADLMPVHVEAITAELRQYDPGLHPNVQYRIYSPSIDLDVLDTVSLSVNGKTQKFKVEALDYISFQGIVLIDIASETRK